jgi:superfamily II DNA/RNA helicase
MGRAIVVTRGAIRVLFVTDVATRWLDVKGIDFVANYDFPPRPKIMLLTASGALSNRWF